MEAVDLRVGAVLRRLPDITVGVEVGVFRGGMSRRLLRHPGITLHMVDSWEAWGDGRYKDSDDYHAGLTQEQQDGYYRDALANTEFALDRRNVLRMRSTDAAETFSDASLDFVFIDADHSYEGCKEDIAAWLPKVKPGGWLGGHDYDHQIYTKFGVKQAVDERFAEVETDADTTWFYRVPGGEKLTICCVKWGTKYDARYVNVLRAMCEKNAPYHEFQCFTDDPRGIDPRVVIRDLPPGFLGWWNKIALFRPGLFDGRVLYLDLDVAVTGRLAPLLSGGIIHDWHVPTYNSSAMCWVAGEHADIWEKYTPDVASRLHGDQDWITKVGGWDTFPPGLCVSYRKSATLGVPAESCLVVFHGEPKPHKVNTGWVPQIWSENGMCDPRYIATVNNDAKEMFAQAKRSLARDLPWLAPAKVHKRKMVLVCGGPSLRQNLLEIRKLKARNAEIFSVNGTHDWLIERGIVPDYHVVLDSRPDNVAFVSKSRDSVKYLISAQCHEAVFAALDGRSVTLWLNDMEGMIEEVKGIADKPVVLIGGGATVGLRTLCIGHVLGFRDVHIFGMDSCYSGEDNHAYPQPMNDNEARKKFMLANGREFICANWMAKQAMEYQALARALMKEGAALTVYGDGLIAEIMRMWNQEALCS